ncbi:MAG: PQQ-binding-like beta-propeller repeat protein [Prolixibacteraceae bacterium]|nr:PQQ-binding-like beta-propeller repeat protein [Prolixibacteraceae bacterium]
MKTLLFLVSTLLVLVSCTEKPVQIAQWRGPDRSGVYHETGLLRAWSDSGPSLLWSSDELGDGYGSPVITEERIFVTGVRDSSAVLFAFDLAGKLLFHTQIGGEWMVNFPGSRTTPTVFGNLVYVMSGVGDVSCVNAESGTLIWQRKVQQEMNGEIPRFGYAQSLVVEGDKVFCSPGGKEHNVVALNRHDGSLVWSCAGKGERPAYHPARLITVTDRKILITFSAYHLLGIDAENGTLLWWHEQNNTPVEKRQPGMGDTHANGVLYNDSIIYYVEGDGNCAVALKLAGDGLSIEQIWNNPGVDNYMGGIVLHHNALFSSSHSSQLLVKMDPANGQVLDSLGLGRGSLIMANELLFYYNHAGKVHLVDVSADPMVVLSEFKFTLGSREHFAHPVINKGVLYLRRGKALAAYAI